MMRPALALLLLAGTPAWAASLPLALHPLTLQEGENAPEIPPGILPKGLSFHVFSAWRDNGNAWSYHMLLMTLDTPDNKATVIDADPLPGQHTEDLRDSVSDVPHTGEDAVVALTLATGNENGKPGLFLIEAVRSGDGPVPASAAASISVFQLVASDGTPGWTPYYFKYLRSIPLKGKFCSADTALISVGLERPEASAAAHNSTGCFDAAN